jgi:hypothetical protein
MNQRLPSVPLVIETTLYPIGPPVVSDVVVGEVVGEIV